MKQLSENVDFFGMPIMEESEHSGHMEAGNALEKPKKVEEPIKSDEKDLEKSKVKPKEIGNGEVKLVPMKGEGSSDDQLDDLSKGAVKPGKVDSKPKEMSESEKLEKLILMGPEAALGEKPEKEDQSDGKEHSEKELPAAAIKTADADKEVKVADGQGVKSDADDEKAVAAAAVKPGKVDAAPKLMAERQKIREGVEKSRKAIGESVKMHPSLAARKLAEEKEKATARTSAILEEAKKKKMALKEGALNSKTIESKCMDIMALASKMSGKEADDIKAACEGIMKEVEKHQAKMK